MSFVWIVLRATAVVGGLMAALVTGGIAHADTAPSIPGIADLGTAVANAPQLLQSVGSALGVLPKPVTPAPPPLAGASITVPQGAVPGLPAAPAASAPTAGIPGLPLTAPVAPAATPQVPSVLPSAPANSPSAHVDVPQLLQNVGSALGVLPKPVTPAPPPLAGASITVPQGAVPGLPAAPSASAPTAGIPGLPLTAPLAPAATPQVPSVLPGAPANSPSAHVDVPQLPFLPLPLPQQLSLPGGLGSVAPGGVPAAGPAVAAPAPALAPADGFLSALP